jgi:hypothetical protein
LQYLADTVAIIRHFANVGKIGKAAKLILQDADSGKNTILISIISIVEILNVPILTSDQIIKDSDQVDVIWK